MRKNYLSIFVLLCYSASFLARPMEKPLSQSLLLKSEDVGMSMGPTKFKSPSHSNLLGHDQNPITLPPPNDPIKEEPESSPSSFNSFNTFSPVGLSQLKVDHGSTLEATHHPFDSPVAIAQNKIDHPLAYRHPKENPEDEFYSPQNSPKHHELKPTEKSPSAVNGDHKADPKGTEPQGTEPKPIPDTPPAAHPPQDGPAPKPGFIKRKWQQFLDWVRTSDSRTAKFIRRASNLFRFNKASNKSESNGSFKGKDVTDGIKLTKTVSSNKLQPESNPFTYIDAQNHLKTNPEGAEDKAAYTVSFSTMKPDMSKSNSVTHTIPLSTDSSKPVQADTKTDAKGVHNMQAETVPTNPPPPKDKPVTQNTIPEPDSSKSDQDGLKPKDASAGVNTSGPAPQSQVEVRNPIEHTSWFKLSNFGFGKAN